MVPGTFLGSPFAVRLDSRQLRQVAQSEIGRLDKSILMPDPVFLSHLEVIFLLSIERLN